MAPSEIEPRMDRPLDEALRSFPLRHRLSDAIDGQHATGTPVVVLGSSISPCAIALAVVAMVVVALNRMARRWSFTHVGQKALKAVTPLAADRNSTCAVVLVRRVGSCVAAAFHRRPDSVLSRAGLVVSSGTIASLAATTARAAIAHLVAIGNHDAVAPNAIADYPQAGCGRFFGYLQGVKESKGLPDDRLPNPHGFILTRGGRSAYA